MSRRRPIFPRFGFDAIRIPLYLIWGGEATHQRLAAMLRFWDGFTDKPIPAWVDVTDGSLAPFPAPAGFQAIVQLTRAEFAAKAKARPAKPVAVVVAAAPAPVIDDSLPQISDKDDYYSASLILLAGLAQQAVAR